MKLFVTGGAGFIGSNFIKLALELNSAVRIVNYDRLTYAGNLTNLAELEGDPRHTFVRGDIANPTEVEKWLEDDCDAVVNFAAESHVDRSIVDSSQFLKTNIEGTHILLEAARRKKIPRFLQVSTDEVYGALGETGKFSEETQLAPNSPYSASKAAADFFVRAYHETYGLDTVTTRCCNNYGPYQFPEKLIPLMVLNAMEEKPLPVYGDGLYTREWIHVEDHCRALLLILAEGRAGEVYNVGGNRETTNLDVIHRILEVLGKSEKLIRFVADRPGHDRRYAIDASKLKRELGWETEIPFDTGLEQTVRWYELNSGWVEQVRSGAYLHYYQKMYEERNQTLAEL